MYEVRRVGRFTKALDLPLTLMIVKRVGRPLAERGTYFRRLTLMCKNVGQVSISSDLKHEKLASSCLVRLRAFLFLLGRERKSVS